MISISNSPNLDLMSIQLTDTIIFGVAFITHVSEFVALYNTVKDRQPKILFSCKNLESIDRLSLAYLYNVCSYLKNKCNAKIYMPKDFYYNINNNVNQLDASEYEIIELKSDELIANGVNHYILNGDYEFSNVVEDLVKLIIDKNLIINKDKVELFLKTTIGEIFSNALNHNTIDEYYFFKDIVNEGGEFYLAVNVIDYGNTIIRNVRNYLKNNGEKLNKSDNYIEWATKLGNTTRLGSGGYGLYTLIDYLEKVKGDLFILSGNEIYYLVNGEKHSIKMDKGFFPGTAVHFKIKLFDLEKFVGYDEMNNTISASRIRLDSI